MLRRGIGRCVAHGIGQAELSRTLGTGMKDRGVEDAATFADQETKSDEIEKP